MYVSFVRLLQKDDLQYQYVMADTLAFQGWL